LLLVSHRSMRIPHGSNRGATRAASRLC
jgi:hypothetical protein